MKILIAAGGTGGHITPGFAVARQIDDLHGGAECLFVCGDRAVERQLFELRSRRYVSIPAVGARSGIGGILRCVIGMIRSMIAMVRILRWYRPDYVLGMGGYVSLAPLLCARLMGIPGGLHEPNVLMGRANKICCRFVKTVFRAYQSTEVLSGRPTVCDVGPVLREDLRRIDRSHAAQMLGIEPQMYTVLIMGGSLGAKKINDLAISLANDVSRKGESIQVVHLCGSQDYQRVKKAYAGRNYRVKFFEFFDDISLVYSVADVAISRGGAASVGELGFFCIPSLLIPFPSAVGDHQTANAQQVQKRGWACVVQEKDVTLEEIRSFVLEAKRCALQRGHNACGIDNNDGGPHHAAQCIAREILEQVR